MKQYDVIIIGAGAAGLFCAIEAGKRKRRVLVIDHANKPGKKILMSGGGRCNFTNYYVSPDKFISNNPHFCKSALSRYTQWDFIELVKQHQIPFHEKTLGQLFCDNKSKDIVNMLLNECDKADVEIKLETIVSSVKKLKAYGFKLKTTIGDLECESLVVASGGLSIPTMGASPFGYQLAEQFGITVWPTRAGLVPLTLQPEDKNKYADLSGIAVDATVSNQQIDFPENILLTHRGISGPAILQISSYWQAGESISIRLLPHENISDLISNACQQHPKQTLKTELTKHLPKRLVDTLIDEPLLSTALQSLTPKQIQTVQSNLQSWQLKPGGTEGYRTAEVTLGGVDCNVISSKTMEAQAVSGLYFIGEVLDVSGWLGGYNFQWAWSSGWAAGQVV